MAGAQEQVHELDRQTREELAAAIDAETDTIIERWLERVQRDAAAAHVSTTELVDGLRFYLRRLVALLRGDQSLASVGASAWRDVAHEHAITRVRLGFDITQLFHELVTLRKVMIGSIRHRAALDEHLVESITDLVSAAAEASLKSYIESRDYASRRLEAEHIGFLTHELKNPLGVAWLAADELRGSLLTSEQRRMCETIERNLARIRRLIDDTLLATRLQAADVETHPVDLTLEQLVGDALDMFRRAAHGKGLQFEARYDPRLTIRADAQLTASATENLLDNAIKYTDRGAVTFVVDEQPDAVAFHVRDHCGGLSAEQLRDIFEPFKRAHTRKPGTGLGLAIARRSIEAQGGAIHAESSPQTGCHFWFELPKRLH